MNHVDFTKIPAKNPSSFSFPSFQGLPVFPLYGYDHMEDDKQDQEYTMHLYSDAVKAIQKEVEEECDKLEYKGSCMYHQYPDKVHLQMITAQIYKKVKALPLKVAPLEMTSLSSKCFGDQCQPTPHCMDGLCPPSPPCPVGMCPPPFPPCTSSSCIQPRPVSDFTSDGKPDWLKGLVDVLFYNEINNRRRRYRSRTKWL